MVLLKLKTSSAHDTELLYNYCSLRCELFSSQMRTWLDIICQLKEHISTRNIKLELTTEGYNLIQETIDILALKGIKIKITRRYIDEN